MFPAEKEGEWEPYKIKEKKIPLGGDGDTEMGGTGNEELNEPIYEEDPDSDEGAVYPLVGTFMCQNSSPRQMHADENFRGAHREYAVFPCTA